MCDFYRLIQRPDSFDSHVPSGHRDERAIVESPIGIGTRVWAFSHIMSDVQIGDNCNIGEGCYIESGVVIGDNVTVKNGVNIWKGVTLENNVFVGPGVCFINDKTPRSKKPFQLMQTIVRQGASIGANATILPVEIGKYAMIGAGAVVTKDVRPHYLMVGNPAECIGMACVCGNTLDWKTFEDNQARHAGEIICECHS